MGDLADVATVDITDVDLLISFGSFPSDEDQLGKDTRFTGVGFEEAVDEFFNDFINRCRMIEVV